LSEQEHEYRERLRRSWAAGDWPAIAPTIQEAADVVVAEIGVAEGHEMLDVGTGNGNAAIVAAKRGARVTGLDLVPKLLAGGPGARRCGGRERRGSRATPWSCRSRTTRSTA
jgi:2-polyprenyl-3-methyl-5-hydroxy-6-metoxy-1,4-benzoquinol methylase